MQIRIIIYIVKYYIGNNKASKYIYLGAFMCFRLSFSISMSSSVVDHPVTNRTVLSETLRGPHISKLMFFFRLSMTVFGRTKNFWLVGEFIAALKPFSSNAFLKSSAFLTVSLPISKYSPSVNSASNCRPRSLTFARRAPCCFTRGVKFFRIPGFVYV